MKNQKQSPEMSQAVSSYLASLEPSCVSEANVGLALLMRWFGPRKQVNLITPSEVSRFSQQMPATDTEIGQKAETIRGFLLYLKKQGWINSNLPSSFKIKKPKTAKAAAQNQAPDSSIMLTEEGYNSMVAELETLKAKRPALVEAIRLAAADKDFRENSPLHAAKEELGHVEGRVRELEETLKKARVNTGNGNFCQRVSLGDCVILKDTCSGECAKYVIVNTREARPLSGKISDSSPIGKALMGKQTGDVVEINTPGGKMGYRIEKVGG